MIKHYRHIFILFLLTFSYFPCYAKELRIAVLKFGSVNWELDVLEHHGLDKEYKLNLKKGFK